MILYLSLPSCTKIHGEWIIDLNITLLKENVGESLQNLAVRQNCYSWYQKYDPLKLKKYEIGLYQN